MQKLTKENYTANEAIDPMIAIMQKNSKAQEQLKSDLVECAAFIAKIKGEITKGKLRWHGIKMHQEKFANRWEYSIWQRGAMITPILKIYDTTFENNNVAFKVSFCPKKYLEILKWMRANSKFSTQELDLKTKKIELL